MRYESPKLRQMLAAEYVLGTLQGGARRRFLRMLHQDAWLRGEVRYWETRFANLSLFEPVPPRPIVWAEIERRMRMQQAQQEDKDRKVITLLEQHAARTTSNAVRFWRAWALLASAACVGLAVLAVKPQIKPEVATKLVEVKVPVQVYVAAVKLPNEDAQWNVSVLPEARTVRISASDLAKIGLDRDYQLWWVSENGVTSLGILPRKGAAQRSIPADVQLKADGKIAVSLEPAGGSPIDDGPTGPVLVTTPVIPSI